MKTIEERLRALEDRAEIVDLIASYGPAADSGNGQAIENMWSADGTYGFDATTLEHSELAGLVDFETHRDYMSSGCAHILTPPTVQIEGDKAVALNYSIVFIHREEPWVAERVSSNRWDLVRTEAGWRVAKRQNRLLNGNEKAWELFTE